MTDTKDQEFEAAIAALSRLLTDEIAAIDKGEMSKVTALFERKSALLTQLEEAAPAMQDKLTAEDDSGAALRLRIDHLRDLVGQDLARLTRMTEATGEIAAEISRIRDRHGLTGLYGAKGKARAASNLPSHRFDKTV